MKILLIILFTFCLLGTCGQLFDLIVTGVSVKAIMNLIWLAVILFVIILLVKEIEKK